MTNSRMIQLAIFYKKALIIGNPFYFLDLNDEIIKCQAAYDTCKINYPELNKDIFLVGWLMEAYDSLFEYLKTMKEEAND